MKVTVNTDLLNEAALRDIGEVAPVQGRRFTLRDVLMAIDLPSGSTLFAITISSINPLAPPALMIRGKSDYKADNRLSARKIVNRLRPACRSKHLPAAVKMMKAAINRLSVPQP